MGTLFKGRVIRPFTHVNENRKVYYAGDRFTGTAEQFEVLVRKGFVEKVGEKPAVKPAAPKTRKKAEAPEPEKVEEVAEPDGVTLEDIKPKRTRRRKTAATE